MEGGTIANGLDAPSPLRQWQWPIALDSRAGSSFRRYLVSFPLPTRSLCASLNHLCFLSRCPVSAKMRVSSQGLSALRRYLPLHVKLPFRKWPQIPRFFFSTLTSIVCRVSQLSRSPGQDGVEKKVPVMGKPWSSLAQVRRPRSPETE